jgi:hypothetical protein
VWTQNLTVSIQEEVADAIRARVMAEKDILTESYYRCVSPAFMNERTRFVLRIRGC